MKKQLIETKNGNVAIFKEDNKIKKIDFANNFISIFDSKTGNYMRTGVLDRETGKDTGVDPFMSAIPELIDVGVMG